MASGDTVMRILMLGPHEGARGPVPRIAANLVDALRESGCDVVTRRWGQRRDDESLGTKTGERMRDVVRLWRETRGREFDVGVVHTSHDWRTLARDAAVAPALRRSCSRLVLQLHGSDSAKLVAPGNRPFKLATRAVLALVDGLLVLSTEEQAQWSAFDPRTPVHTVKNPYVPHASPEGPDGPAAASAGRRVLFVGRLIAEKGVLDLVDAFARVAREVECTLVIVGTGEDEPRVRRRVVQLEIENLVEIKGHLSPADVRTEYEQAAVFVFPTAWSEGFPTVLAEAMDAGLPIVTTGIRGAADHLVAGEHALFVQSHDVDAIAAAMRTLLEDPGLAARMGDANRRRVEIFRPDVAAAEYLQALRSIREARDLGYAVA